MTQTITEKTVTTSVSEQSGTKLVVTDNPSTQSFGEVVTDITTSLYIASGEVFFAAWNLRPNHIHHVFFDGINVDNYCAPASTPMTRLAAYGTAVYTNENGYLSGVFLIPESTFKTGDRVLEIADVPDLLQGQNAIVSKATATFTSSNISVTKKLLTLTTINPEVKVENINNRVVNVDTQTKVTNEPDQTIYNIVYGWYEPIAQALTINTPNGQDGIFATKLDLYFKQKSLVAGHGVTVYLCEIKNGYPDGNAILPYSTKHLTNDQILTDASNPLALPSSTPTTFTFDSPVFMSANKQYAFIVRPDGNDPDFWVYSAEIGNEQPDLLTGGQISSVPVVGTAYYGATMTTWTALQKEYIKFVLHRANFNTSDGYAYFNNTDSEFIQMKNITYRVPGNSVKPGHFVFKSTDATLGTVNTQVYATVDSFAPNVPGLQCEYSTGNFPTETMFYVQVHDLPRNSTTGAPVMTLSSSTLVAHGNVYPVVNPKYNGIVPQFASMSPAGTKLSYSYRGTSNAYAVDSSYADISVGTEKELLDYERLIVSKSKEVSAMSGTKSTSFNIKLSTDNSFTSPVIDTVVDNHTLYANDINPIASIYNEFFGSSPTRSKYVSKVVTLASGQDAQDLQITISAHKPPNSQIQVWVKFMNAEDSESMAQKTWTPMRDIGSSVYCDPMDPNDIKEFTYSTPYSYPLIPTSGTVSACTGACTVYGTGTTTTFGTDIAVGMYLNFKANSTWREISRQVVSMSSANNLTLNQGFTNDYTSNAIYIVPPPTTAYKSTNNSITLTGTVNTSITNTSITGVGTNFTGELVPGSVISVAGDKQQVISISNATALTVGTPWSSAVTGATAYSIIPAGVTYYNSSNNLFSTFNQFQIKVVLMTNDSSKVPIIDDLRALALQL